MTAATTSIGFVITAIYTGTFANAVYQVLEFNETAITIQLRTTVTVSVLLCSAMCMIMAMRFFFGNNNFIEDLFTKPRSVGERVYHFLITTIQSLILLGSSYLIRNPPEFIKWLVLLFAVEVAWYVGCLVFARTSVRGKDGRLNLPLLANEIANLSMATGATIVLLSLGKYPNVSAYVVSALFVANTAVDLKVNLRAYMGDLGGSG